MTALLVVDGEGLGALTEVRCTPLQAYICNAETTAEHLQKSLVIHRIKRGAEVEQDQRTDVAGVSGPTQIVVIGNNGDLSRVVSSVGWLTTGKLVKQVS